jgi:hypothetical protein
MAVCRHAPLERRVRSSTIRPGRARTPCPVMPLATPAVIRTLAPLPSLTAPFPHWLPRLRSRPPHPKQHRALQQGPPDERRRSRQQRPPCACGSGSGRRSGGAPAIAPPLRALTTWGGHRAGVAVTSHSTSAISRHSCDGGRAVRVSRLARGCSCHASAYPVPPARPYSLLVRLLVRHTLDQRPRAHSWLHPRSARDMYSKGEWSGRESSY